MSDTCPSGQGEGYGACVDDVTLRLVRGRVTKSRCAKNAAASGRLFFRLRRSFAPLLTASALLGHLHDLKPFQHLPGCQEQGDTPQGAQDV